ncbi:hypothetical protein BHE74_00018322 [Ensete ventricosum]|nr:hypothetical protein BHE74_00018322 [Ensete ventricosum]
MELTAKWRKKHRGGGEDGIEDDSHPIDSQALLCSKRVRLRLRRQGKEEVAAAAARVAAGEVGCGREGRKMAVDGAEVIEGSDHNSGWQLRVVVVAGSDDKQGSRGGAEGGVARCDC